MTYNKQEIRRYLGIQAFENQQDPDLEEAIDRCAKEIHALADPRVRYQTFSLAFEQGFPVINGELVESRDLAKNLSGCTSVVLFALTLGASIDRLIMKAQARSMAEAAILQACAAEAVEEACDRINEVIKEEARSEGLLCKPRYSPGYGDLKLSYQTSVFSLLKPQTIGLTLNDSLLMSPSKSVTALIGRYPQGGSK